MFDRTTAQIPKYRLRKPSGRGVVRLNGRDIFLGTHGAPESKERYRQVIAEWLAKNRQLAARCEFVAAPHTLSVAELLLAYLNHAASYYVKNGQPTREVRQLKARGAAKSLRNNGLHEKRRSVSASAWWVNPAFGQFRTDRSTRGNRTLFETSPPAEERHGGGCVRSGETNPCRFRAPG